MENLEIILSDNERRHLLLTGKNGSGKTSLLEILSRYLRQVANAKNFSTPHGKKPIEDLTKKLLVHFSYGFRTRFENGEFVLAYFPANRKVNISLVNGVENVKLDENYDISKDPAENLVKYMVHLKTQQAYARQENDSKVEAEIQSWFDRFENALKILLEDATIKLEYDYKRYNFLVH